MTHKLDTLQEKVYIMELLKSLFIQKFLNTQLQYLSVLPLAVTLIFVSSISLYQVSIAIYKLHNIFQVKILEDREFAPPSFYEIFINIVNLTFNTEILFNI